MTRTEPVPAYIGVKDKEVIVAAYDKGTGIATNTFTPIYFDRPLANSPAGQQIVMGKQFIPANTQLDLVFGVIDARNQVRPDPYTLDFD